MPLWMEFLVWSFPHDRHSLSLGWAKTSPNCVPNLRRYPSPFLSTLNTPSVQHWISGKYFLVKDIRTMAVSRSSHYAWVRPTWHTDYFVLSSTSTHNILISPTLWKQLCFLSSISKSFNLPSLTPSPHLEASATPPAPCTMGKGRWVCSPGSAAPPHQMWVFKVSLFAPLLLRLPTRCLFWASYIHFQSAGVHECVIPRYVMLGKPGLCAR